MKLMCCTFIMKNVINCTEESRTASIANRYTRNKYGGHLSRGVPFYVRVINRMKLMCCTFILKNIINCTDESRTASSVNRYTRNK